MADHVPWRDEDGGQHGSAWRMTRELPEWPPLLENTRADVCIVGGGIAGLTTAFLLAQEGKQVVLLDAVQLGGGETHHTTAHLSNAIDDRYAEILRLHGPTGAQLAAHSHTAAISRIENIAAAQQIDCDFVRLPGYLFLGPADATELLKRELSAAKISGLHDVWQLQRVPIAGTDLGPCLCFDHQAQFHPLRYLAGLARAFERAGGVIHGHTRVTGYDTGSGGNPALLVKTESGRRVEAAALVLATNSPIESIHRVHLEQTAYRTYVVAGRIPSGSLPRALYWDTQDPYHYIRVQPEVEPGQDLLIIGGEDHRTGHAEEPERRWGALTRWGRSHFPMLGAIDWHWSGQVMESVDGLAYIGRTGGKEPVYLVTGDSGMGMTHGTIAGMLLTDLIVGRENPWTELYDPGRTTLQARGEFMREAIHMAAGYTDWLTPGEISNVDEVQPGSGAILRHGLAKLAIYRDDQGQVHRFSAICQHLGCIVRWNSAESTWDCPCHGSRFSAMGEVLNGPSKRPLPREDDHDA